MATYRRTVMEFMIILTILLQCVHYSSPQKRMPNKAIVTDWATSITKNVIGAMQTVTGDSLLEKAYKNITSPYITAEFEKIDLDDIVNKMAANLSSMLSNKMDALNTSVVRAQQAASKHHFIPNIKKEDVPYQNAKTLMDNDSRLIYNDRFKQKIIPNISSVHIPVEIINGGLHLIDVQKSQIFPFWVTDHKYEKILNGLKWSAALDEVFKENYDKDPEILWQYFGSQTGFMRTLPASIWKTEPQSVDLYDVRRRPWYTQGASSPKDMFILIDMSGSVHGQTLELIKVSVKSLLDTLGENDFVNIAQFNDTAKFVSDCFNGSFVQANYRNKQILMQDVEKIEAAGMADFKRGLTFAFEQFEKLKTESEGRQGANCNRMIMLLTDGGSELAEEVFQRYNPKGNKTYRVFTYAVGPTANPVSAIRWMACVNRGYFSQIPAMGAIRSKVQGLGMMTTVTLPVYNKTDGSTNQTILGVMGIDVTTDAMLKYAPLRKFGPNGYPFAINANGYIVFHPKLKLRTIMKDPPNVDFLDVEVENEGTEKLRKDMIDGKTGSVELDMYMVSDDQHHVDVEKGEKARRFSYKEIASTTFSLAVSLPAYHQYYLKLTANIKKFMENENKLLHAGETALLIADWDYYENFTGNSNRNGTILDLLEALENSDSYEWNEELISHLLWDLEMTSKCNDYWQLTMNSENSQKMASLFKGVFVGTNGGLTRIYPKSGDIVESFMDKRSTWDAKYFKRAVDSPKWIFSAPYVLVPEPPENGTVGDVTAVRNITIEYDKKYVTVDYRAAVVGLVFKQDSLKMTMVDNTHKYNTNGFYDCGDSEALACYLLDDGGFVIATNQDEYNTSVGRFFGKVDPEVMNDLYNRSVYKRTEQFDYQATCPPPSEAEGHTSAGSLSFRIPSISVFFEFITLNWWTNIVSWAFTNFNLYNLMAPSPSTKVYASVPEKPRMCIKKQAQYYFDDNLSVMDGSVECEVRNIQCSREYVAAPMEGTNLLFVVVETHKPDCEECRAKVTPLLQEPVEENPEFCEMKPRYRRPTEMCYDHDDREDDTQCTGSLTHPVSYTAISLVAIFTILFIQR